jgi:hypothetical protein
MPDADREVQATEVCVFTFLDLGIVFWVEQANK